MRLSQWIAPILVTALLGCGTGAGAPNDDDDAPEVVPARETARPVSGFARAAWARQLERERTLRARVQARRCENHVKELTRRPHVAGSEANAAGADYLAAQLARWGYQVDRHEYEVLLPYPVDVAVEITEPFSFSAGLREEPIPSDPDTHAQRAILPYNAFTPDADFTAPVVYVNYGRREDYATLKGVGVEPAGKIVLARYGRIFRGSKAALAEEAGAAGLLLYSDPADDGFARGDVYPEGVFRPDHGVQRGSILYMFRYPGDPGTPGRPSVAGARQSTYDEMESLPGIPTTCLSHADAQPILESLDGPGVPEGWQGGLPFTYHVGSTTPRVRLKLAMDYALRPITNVVATLPGLRFADQWIIAGNHRDAWVHGAVDPASGTAVLLEAARVLGAAAAAGDGPDRTVRFAFWDAEEFGMIGSTEWGEQFSAEIDASCAVYLNVDAAVSGPRLSFSGVPALRALVSETLASIERPGGATMLDELRRGDGSLRYGTLGAGSDYTVFLAHLGVASLDFSSGGRYGAYHTAYDTFAYVQRQIDPGFGRHAEMARLAATLLARLAGADLLPFDFAATGAVLAEAAGEVERGRSIDLAEIREVAAVIEEHGAAINEARRRALGRGSPPLELAAAVNRDLLRAERALLLPRGLPQRPWYRHALHAPHPDVGYGSAPLPPLTDALRSGDRAAAQRGATAVVGALRRLADHLAGIRRRLETLAGVDDGGEESSDS